MHLHYTVKTPTRKFNFYSSWLLLNFTFIFNILLLRKGSEHKPSCWSLTLRKYIHLKQKHIVIEQECGFWVLHSSSCFLPGSESRQNTQVIYLNILLLKKSFEQLISNNENTNFKAKTLGNWRRMWLLSFTSKFYINHQITCHDENQNKMQKQFSTFCF